MTDRNEVEETQYEGPRYVIQRSIFEPDMWAVVDRKEDEEIAHDAEKTALESLIQDIIFDDENAAAGLILF